MLNDLAKADLHLISIPPLKRRAIDERELLILITPRFMLLKQSLVYTNFQA